jgi:hypothetical protein
MRNLSDSCRIDRLPISVRQLAVDAHMSFPLSLTAFIRDDHCPHTRCLTLHLKFLDTPTVPVRTMLVSMRTVYDTADIGVRVGSREALSGPTFATLVDVDIGTCTMGQTTAEQNQLFANRNGATADDVVIYLVRSTVPAKNGCAAHPNQQPGAVVARIGSRWTMAHETGHVLGLSHISGEDGTPGVPCSTPDFTQLMTGCGTSNIAGTPTVSGSETSTMRSSSSMHDCPR